MSDDSISLGTGELIISLRDAPAPEEYEIAVLQARWAYALLYDEIHSARLPSYIPLPEALELASQRAKEQGLLRLRQQTESSARYRRQLERAHWRTVPWRMRHRMLARGDHRCGACGAREGLTVDHKVPIARGGLTVPDNLQVLCRSCNSRKGAR